MTDIILERKITELFEQVSAIKKELILQKTAKLGKKQRTGKSKNTTIKEWDKISKEITKSWDNKHDAVSEIWLQRDK